MKSVLFLLISVLPYVNTFIGTGGHGHTFPGATYPFGSIQLSPDTRPDPADWDGASGYNYADTLIYGFSHTHLSGTGGCDWCDLLMMPAVNVPDTVDRKIYASPFSHEREKASPGYYEVFLDKPGVQVRLTAGQRIGVHEYTYPKDAEPIVVIDLTHRDRLLESSLTVARNDPHVVYGVRKSSSWARSQELYFVIRFSRPVLRYKADDKGAVLHFRPSRDNVLTAKVSISSVSPENAMKNQYVQEDNEFEEVRLDTAKEWDNFLGTVECPFDDHERRTIFYTALYHCAIHPSLYGDCDGSYRSSDKQVWAADNFDRYTVFSLWDTFRGLHPLLADLSPDLTYEFLNSFLAIFKENGKLPVWELSGYETNTMIGYHSAPVIAECIARGLTECDLPSLLSALVVSSNTGDFGLASFRANGCVLGEDEYESVSKTLEYAYDDWCVAQVAKYLMEKYSSNPAYITFKRIYDQYMISCQYWRNVFDPSTGFVRPRVNGRWLEPFDPREVNCHFTEANAWQYSFSVPHDIVGLMKAMGGPSGMCSRLDSLFHAPVQTTGDASPDISGQIGQYAHGNEPSHHIPFLYAVAGRPERTEETVRQIMDTMYANSPDGLCGNDDCGQLSAWYVLAALGNYPVCPGAGDISLTYVPKTIIVNPVFEMESDIIKDSLVVSIGNIDSGCRAFYRTEEDGTFTMYEKPFTITEPCTLEAYSMSRDGKKSFTVRSIVTRRPEGVSISGPDADDMLVDGIRGCANWKAGHWKAFKEKDMDVTLDLGAIKEIHEVGIGICQDTRLRIWYPQSVEFYASVDGQTFRKLAARDIEVSKHEDTAHIQDVLATSSKGFYARHIRVVVKNRGIIPSWHYAAGFPCTMLVDEIWVE